MAFVKQKHKTDCGIAALAMLCDVEYEEANRAIPWRREGCLSGTTTKQLIEGAAKLGYETRHNRLQVIRPPEGWVEEHGTTVDHRIWSFIGDNSLVKMPMFRNWHWVVWRKGKIYDPALGVFKPTKYLEFAHGNYPSSSLQFLPEGTEDCPKCGTPTEAQWSGIKCPNCGWAFCL